MKTRFAIVVTIIICTCLTAYSQNPKLKSVFNGKNLKGWVVPENNIWWSVSDGIITAKNGPDLKGSIIWTEKKYGNFVVETEFRFGGGTVDSGIFLRTDKHQIQIGISASLKVDMTASPYIAGKAYPVKAEGVDKVLKQKDWNLLKVEVQGTNYKVWLNGQQVLNYDSKEVFAEGPIGLQLHAGKEMAIDFRNVKVAKLK